MVHTYLFLGEEMEVVIFMFMSWKVGEGEGGDSGPLSSEQLSLSSMNRLLLLLNLLPSMILYYVTLPADFDLM